jgi:heme exporter protein D
VSRWFLGIGPALLLASCAVAMAQDGGGAVAAVPGPTSMPSADFLLSMGPYGALVWGAYLLGKGVKVTVQIELSERDRELIEKIGRGGQ